MDSLKPDLPEGAAVKNGESVVGSFFQQAQQYAQMWTGFATKMASAGMTFDPRSAPPELARQMRGTMFQAMAQYTEEFMRSPEFLAMMKQTMDASLDFRKQMNEMLTGMHHSVQGIARQDIDSLMLSIRHMETRILDRLESLSDRVEQLSQRLDAIEGGQEGAPSEKETPSKRQPKRAKG